MFSPSSRLSAVVDQLIQNGPCRLRGISALLRLPPRSLQYGKKLSLYDGLARGDQDPPREDPHPLPGLHIPTLPSLVPDVLA